MVKQIPSLHPDYRECILDIDIFGRIVSSPQPSFEQLKEMLFEEYSQRTPMPTLESKRYELSRQVSDDYKVSYSGELELQDNESLVDLQRQPSGVVFEDLSSLIPGNIHSEVQECFRYEVGAHDDFRQRIVDEYDIESLEEFKPGIRATENIVGSTSEDESLVLTDEEIDRLGSEPEEGQLAEFDDSEDGVVFAGDSVDEDGADWGEIPAEEQPGDEDSDDDVYAGYSDEDEEAEHEEDADDGVDFGDLSDEGVDLEDAPEEPKPEEQVPDGEPDESEEDDGVDFGELPADEDDGVDFGDMPSEDEAGVGEEDDDSGVDFGEIPAEEEDDGVDFGELQPEEGTGVDFDELPQERASAVGFEELSAEGAETAETGQEDDDDGVDFGDIQDEEEDDGVDFGDIPEDGDQEEQDDGVSFEDFGVDSEPEFIEASAPSPPPPPPPPPPRAPVQQIVQPVVPQSAEPVVDRSSEPTDIRAFVRKHPRCDVQFALKFFTKKQIDDAVRLGRIIKKGNTLR